MNVHRLARLACLVSVLVLPISARAEASKAPPSLCGVRYASDVNVEWACHRLRRGETLERLFGARWIDVARFNRIDRRHAVAGVEIKVPARLDAIANFTPMPSEYEDARTDAKFILIDLGEQFLGAYEHGRLVFSTPVATGGGEHPTPTGDFRITAVDPARASSLYKIEGTCTSYPMNHALRFHVDDDGVQLWIHGRDLPGYAASHGCIGLYDEPMQRKVYGQPREPQLNDARRLFEWVLGGPADGGGVRALRDGPRVRITGTAPRARG